MEEQMPEMPIPAYGRLWWVVAVAFFAAAVWVGVALASRGPSAAASSPAASALLMSGYVASKAAPSIASKGAQGNCPNMGSDSGSSNGSTTTPGL